MTRNSVSIVTIAFLASACTLKLVGETPELEPPTVANAAGFAGSTQLANLASAGIVLGGIASSVAGASAGSIAESGVAGTQVSAAGGQANDISNASAGHAGARNAGAGNSGIGNAGSGNADPNGSVAGDQGSNSGGFENGGSALLTVGIAGSAGNPSLNSTVTLGGSASTGGALAVGGGSSVAGNSGAAGSTGAAAASDWKIIDHYVTVGDWHGFGWGYLTDANAGSIETTIANDSICTKGVMNADTSYQLNAGVAIHVNQDANASSVDSSYPVHPWLVSSGGVTVHFTNPGGSLLRMFLGNSITKQYYCFELTALSSPVTVAWTDFNTSCWDGNGSSLAQGTEMLTFGLFVQSLADRAVQFDFCLKQVILTP